ncbi:MAG: S-adenosylmethionine:tRNA ribosyltransferase-isomerase [Gaiellaceae bacterium]|nr:S-adenosylmethionine:tRNA ribosyltransferase-isomerase [Gaiellaceae bacterium]
MSAAAVFELPAALEAHEPPAARGLARDAVRLLVLRRGDGSIEHARFRDLPRFLSAGDVLVLNTSGTLAASLPARRANGMEVDLHLSSRLAPGRWVVELRRGGAPFLEAEAGERIRLPAGLEARLLRQLRAGRRLWVAALDPPAGYLDRHGEPIRYSHVPRRWPLASYQTVYATERGSAEAPSAGLAFTPELLTRLIAGGVLVAPLLLHAGVSSPEAHETPPPEWYRVPPATARLVNAARGWGGRIVAVGTTVVRALESVAVSDGTVAPGEGWTELVVTPDRGVRAVDGLLTGWHEPRSSHLSMLATVAGPELLDRSYDAALEHRYLWHEFGDLHLVLP